MLVEETEGVAVTFFEAVAAVIDELLLVEDVMLVDEVVDAVGVLVEIVGKAVPVESVVDGPVGIDELLLVEDIMVVDEVVDAVDVLVEIVGKAVPVECVVDGPVGMLVTMEELCTFDVEVSGICTVVDDIFVAVVVKDCVVMPVILEEFWTVGVLVDNVFMPVENNGDRVLVEIVVVDKLLPVGEFWTVDVVICVNLLVEKTAGVTENFVEGVAVVLSVAEEEIRLVDPIVDGVVMVVENICEGIEVDIDVDESKDMPVMVEELCVVEVVCMVVDILVAAVFRDCAFMLVVLEEFSNVVVLVCGVVMPCDNDGEGVAVEIISRVVDVLLPVEELWTAGLVTRVNLLVKIIDGVAENFVEVVAVVVHMLSLGVSMVAEKVGEGVAVKIVD
ncbi:hypothetical protein QQF64_029532 [Cirrhinus molitorella]|uniref:Uncharacterized protein n=1 Tax=Cirrhinus molitorella TaxID=172907 RepID=A0ABR3N113_9TELE